MGSKSNHEKNKHESSEAVKKSKKKVLEAIAGSKIGDKKKKQKPVEINRKNEQNLEALGILPPTQRSEKKGHFKNFQTKPSLIKREATQKSSSSDSDSSSSDDGVGSSLKKKCSSSSSEANSSSDEDSDRPTNGADKVKKLPAQDLPLKSSKKTIPSTQKALTHLKAIEKRKLPESAKISKSVADSPRKKVKLTEKKIYTSSEDDDDDDDDDIMPKSELGKTKEQKGEVDKDDKSNTDCFLDGWRKSDVFDLINKMETAIPRNDTLKYNSRVEKLNWDQIKFDPYTAEECKERWKQIEKRLRGFRILEELLVDAKEWIEKPWTDFYRSGKKNRHPDLPKRPLTSYMLFYLEKKEKYAKKNPGLEMTSLSKVIAENYKNLSQKKRDRYNALALNMREEYKEKMQKFLQEHPVEALRISKNTIKKSPQGMPGPIKPVPPFKLFLEAKLKQHKNDKDFHSTVFMHECKNKWKSMSNKKKMPWIRWAHENEVKYLDEIKLYKTENPNFEVPNFKSILSKEEKIILDRMQGKPEKPPNSAYSLFSRVMLKDPELRMRYDTPKERMQEIAKLWKGLPKIDREMYGEEVKRMIDSYKMEYATYLDSLTEEQREEELANSLPKRKLKEPVPKNLKKMKQVMIKDILTETNSPEAKEPAVPTDIFSREPSQPPGEPFLVFKEEFMKKDGGTEKRAKKMWMAMANEEKETYKAKLEELKQQFFIDYKAFLTSLNPDELKAYSTYRVNSMVAKQKEDNTESEESDSSSESSEESEGDGDDDDEDIKTDAREKSSEKSITKEDSNEKSKSSDSSSSSDEDSDSD